MKCIRCKETYDDELKLCPYCGSEKPASIICPECLLEPNLEYEFCPNCGTELVEKEEFIKNNLDKENEWVEKAKEQMKLDKEEALKYFNKLILLKPENDYYWHSKAYILMDLEEYEEALECYNKLIEQNPENTNYWIRKTKCLRKLRKPFTIQDRELLEKYDLIANIESEILFKYKSRPNISWKDRLSPIIYNMRFEIEIIDGYLTLLYMDNTQERFLLNLIDHHKELSYYFDFSILNSIMESYERSIERIREILDKYLTEYQNEETQEIINQLKSLLKNKTNEFIFNIRYLKNKIFNEYSESMMKNNNWHIMERLFGEINECIEKNVRDNCSVSSITRAQELLDNLKILTNEEILELINESLEASPSNKKILSLKGEYLSRLGKIEEALEIFNDNDLHYQQIQTLKSLKRYDEAIDCYNILIKETESPEKSKIIKEKIELLKELNRKEEAVECYTLLIKETRSSYDKKDYIKEKIELLKELNRKEETIECYTLLIEESEYGKENYIKEKIELLKELERYDEAIDCYTLLIEETTSLYKMKGHLKEKIGLLKELERYEEALDVCDEYPFLKEEKIEVLEKLERYDEIKNLYKHSIKINKNRLEKCLSEKGKSLNEQVIEGITLLNEMIQLINKNKNLLIQINEAEDIEKLVKEYEIFIYNSLLRLWKWMDDESFIFESIEEEEEGYLEMVSDICDWLLEINPNYHKCKQIKEDVQSF